MRSVAVHYQVGSVCHAFWVVSIEHKSFLAFNVSTFLLSNNITRGKPFTKYVAAEPSAGNMAIMRSTCRMYLSFDINVSWVGEGLYSI